MIDDDALRRAIALASASVARGGGPFGAVVVKDGRIVGEGSNRVTLENDPSAHAEIVALRDACRRLGTFKLDGAVVYSSCEPCPMCWSAIQWSRAARVCFGASQEDAAAAGFDDAVFWREVTLPPERRAVRSERRLPREALAPFDAWRAKADKTPY
ncbi:MAG: nucleoside deaminase [Alphaproteobacteria bacterium]|nr:nucleoside deaminase [Alphaproteobacteria bacterium]